LLADVLTGECDAFVVGGEVHGAPDSRLEKGLASLAARGGDPFLVCRLGWNGEHWVFDGASAFPDAAPADVIEAVAARLVSAAQERS
jgi:hypothetical protein